MGAVVLGHQRPSSTAQAHTGTASLKVSITAPHGWGVTQSNWPGFVATPGPKTIGFWGRAGSGTDLGATMFVPWRNESGTVLRTDTIALSALHRDVDRGRRGRGRPRRHHPGGGRLHQQLGRRR